MSFHPWADIFKFGSPGRRAVQARWPRSRRRRSAGHKLSLETLEDRSLPSTVGPLPIPGGILDPTPFAGPDVHLHLPGPVDSSTPNTKGGDPSSIYDFNGFVGAAHIQGTGIDGSGNTLNWDADVRFMSGVYQGVDGNIHQGTFAFV
jgi:hypothetical protein